MQPIDRAAITLMVVLVALTGLLLLTGSHTAPRVREFSWQDKQVSADDTAFLLTFSRPMDQASVEQNLRIEPPLSGKFSWAGRRMAYTLDLPAPYGQTFEVQLQGGRDRFSQAGQGASMTPFVGQFRTHDRAVIYLGVEGNQAGRLVLNNLTRKQQTILTPPNLMVMDYEPYPQGDRILFSASDRNAPNGGFLDQQIYTVTTGIHVDAPARSPTDTAPEPQHRATAQPAGVIEQVLDNRDYQNLKFDLAPNGEFFAVQRVNRANPAEFGLWLVRPGEAPQPLEGEPGGDFLIAPDSTSVAMAQGEGMAILPLDSNADPLDFLPRFGVVLSFAQDGSAAAMVRFNRDPVNPTRSLFLVTSQGAEEELLTTSGSILTAQFDPQKRYLYCLVTQRLPGDEYVEQPLLVAVNVATAERVDLLKLPIQRDIQMSLAPDGLGILFDQVVSDANSDPAASGIQGSDGKAIATSRLWFLPILTDAEGKPTQTTPQLLPISGLRPRWLP